MLEGVLKKGLKFVIISRIDKIEIFLSDEIISINTQIR